MLKQLKQQYSSQLRDIDKEILQYKEGVDSFAIINDPNFKTPGESSSSLSKLNDSLTTLNENLLHLNNLWVIKNFIKEIEVSASSTSDVLLGLEFLFLDFEKLDDKIQKLNPDLIVKFELANKYNELLDDVSQKLKDIFNQFLPSSEKFVPTIEGIQFTEFLVWFEKFSSINDKLDIGEILAEYKMVWESYIQGTSFKKLNLVNTELIIEDSDGSVLEVLNSILSFVQFINLLDLQSLKNTYQSNISNKLINLISKNISLLVNTNSLEYSHLVDIIKTTYASNWRLSMNLAMDNFDQKMQDLYGDWLMDNFIDRLRTVYKNADFTTINEIKWHVDSKRLDVVEGKIGNMEKKIARAMSSQLVSKANNDWDSNWDDNWEEDHPQAPNEPALQEEQDDEDGWGNDWNDWDEDEEQPKPETRQEKTIAKDSESVSTISTTINISQVPHEVVEILNDFQIESTAKIDPLVSTILSLSSISYPSIASSFLIYNDLQYLSKNTGSEKINKFAESMIYKRKNEISSQLIEILFKIHEENDNTSIIEHIDSWFEKLYSTDLRQTNFLKFKDFVHFAIDFCANWLTNLILSVEEITEEKADNMTSLISKFFEVFKNQLSSIDETENLESMNKLDNIRFLINNHLVQIIERFYQGEFYNITTEELVGMIKSCFIKSELRDNYINEIVEFRNIS